ncbi:CCA-adding enzyme [Pyrolobus fumarii 1A]|uniref:CCA-adding enzyme n=1 Tax=Pyrolobus fumarii (strain DSM 11204 / 1A) TaxID=694429 RepID=G0EHB2_PYRF1|nr:CCA tRNA nucleotidyltransferase [Pyrolobus fumarii]AEM39336.1 CCA-adding enzyme [Pyrolobus fumarii 1A]
MKCPRSRVEEEVLNKIRPKPWELEKANRVWSFVRERLEDTLAAKGINAEVTLQGSVAKGTWLSGDLDIDVFVLFDREWRAKLNEAKEIFREAFRDLPVEERYAAHPYIRVLVEDVWVDVVPALRVRSGLEAETAVDRTPFHTKYILERLDDEKRDEVRLLKKFLKGIGVYGAEVAVQGFSGYLAELLIVAFGCFRNVLEKAARWKPPVVIDIEGHYGGVVDAVLEKFRDSPLIVIDPVDPRRNVAAAVSVKSLAWFVLAAREYLRQPSIKFFEPPSYPSEPHEILSVAGPRAWKILVVRYDVNVRSPDVGWGVARAAARRLVSLLEERGYYVIDRDAFYCEQGRYVLVAVEVLEHPLPQPLPHRGPEVWLEERASRFVQKSLERGDIGPWVDEKGVLWSLRWIRVVVEDIAVRAKPRETKMVTIATLGDAILGGWNLCPEAWRWLYRFTVKRPAWLA